MFACWLKKGWRWKPMGRVKVSDMRGVLGVLLVGVKCSRGREFA
jgi:hypothetical protein